MARKYYKKYNYSKKRYPTKLEKDLIGLIMFLVVLATIFYIVIIILKVSFNFLIESGIIQILIFGTIVYFILKKRHQVMFFFKSKDKQFKDLIKILKEIKALNFQKIRDEESLEDQLMIHLDHLNYNVSRQEKIKNKKIDLVINHVYAIELKLFEGKTSELQRLSGQIEDYLEHFKYVGVVIFTTKNYDNKELEKYLKRYNSKNNVYAIKIIGNIKRKKSKTRYIMVN